MQKKTQARPKGNKSKKEQARPKGTKLYKKDTSYTKKIQVMSKGTKLKGCEVVKEKGNKLKRDHAKREEI